MNYSGASDPESRIKTPRKTHDSLYFYAFAGDLRELFLSPLFLRLFFEPKVWVLAHSTKHELFRHKARAL